MTRSVRTHLKSSTHTSTLYALNLLTFLAEKPHTRRQLQARFQAHTLGGIPLSNDTLRLYADVLEAAGGCQIERPNAANQFHYRLHHTPFGLAFTASEWDVFLEGVQQGLSHGPVESCIRLYRLVRDLLNSPYLRETQKEQLASLCEPWVPSSLFPVLALMYETAVPGHSLYQLRYATTPTETWTVVYDALVCHYGRLYLLCFRYADSYLPWTPLLLRGDRCLDIQAAGQIEPNEAKYQDTLHTNTPLIETDLIFPQGVNMFLPGLNHERMWAVLPEALLWPEAFSQAEQVFQSPCHVVRYRVQTAHTFYIRYALRHNGAILLPRNQETWHALRDEKEG
jgi:hypothetical protein